MSTQFVPENGSADDSDRLQIVRYWGGTEDGTLVQITITDDKGGRIETLLSMRTGLIVQQRPVTFPWETGGRDDCPPRGISRFGTINLTGGA